jgi:hypothetical protein
LAKDFSQELADRYRFALDLTIHAPRDFPGSDPRNFHAHLLATTREVKSTGLAAKTSLELCDSKRRELGLPPVINELLFVRERWAAVTNEALKDAHIEARVDHRSLAAQGIDREPYPYIPRAAYEMERHGHRSGLAERLRMEYQTRVQARLERQSARELPGQGMHAATERPDANAHRPQTLEEIRRQSVENWLRLRRDAATQAEAEPVAVRARDKDDYLAH